MKEIKIKIKITFFSEFLNPSLGLALISPKLDISKSLGGGIQCVLLVKHVSSITSLVKC